MAVNCYRPHLIVLPEDDATRSLAVGFSDQAKGQMKICTPAGGWPHVLREFQRTYVAHLTTYVDGHVLMVIDFDQQYASRLAHFKQGIPPNVADRVYILGAEDEAETLKSDLRMSLGPLGAELARECRAQHHVHWLCSQLQHNQPEVARLNTAVRPFLF